MRRNSASKRSFGVPSINVSVAASSRDYECVGGLGLNHSEILELLFSVISR